LWEEYEKMSRTYKDAPWWVRSNDVSNDRVTYHNHARFGEEIRTWSVDRDKDGNQKFIEVFDEHSNTVRFVKKYKSFVTGYVKDYCTVDEPEAEGSGYPHSGANPCGHMLDYHNWNRPSSKDKVLYHKGRRSRATIALRKPFKAFNSGEAIDDYDSVDTQYNEALHRGAWY
jgi:hypothetical protein